MILVIVAQCLVFHILMALLLYLLVLAVLSTFLVVEDDGELSEQLLKK